MNKSHLLQHPRLYENKYVRYTRGGKQYQAVLDRFVDHKNGFFAFHVGEQGKTFINIHTIINIES